MINMTTNMEPMAKRTILWHHNVYLEDGDFRCGCGSEFSNKHVLKFSDGTQREECDTCFIFDHDAINAGLLDNPNSYIAKTYKNKEKKRDDEDSLFGLVSNYRVLY